MTKKKVLFVCLGNICRSPTAETIFRHYLEQEGLAQVVSCDSAGISGYHQGEPADTRMRKHASLRGYKIEGRSRPVIVEDFLQFDYLIGMDEQNVANLKAMDQAQEYHHKILLMTQFGDKIQASGVPDPYYGGDDGFERVIDILEDSCLGFLKLVKKSL